MISTLRLQLPKMQLLLLLLFALIRSCIFGGYSLSVLIILALQNWFTVYKALIGYLVHVVLSLINVSGLYNPSKEWHKCYTTIYIISSLLLLFSKNAKGNKVLELSRTALLLNQQFNVTGHSRHALTSEKTYPNRHCPGPDGFIITIIMWLY